MKFATLTSAAGALFGAALIVAAVVPAQAASMKVTGFREGVIPLYTPAGAPLASVKAGELHPYLPIEVVERRPGGRLLISIGGKQFQVDGVLVDTDPPIDFVACPPGKVARAATNKTAGSRGSNAIECVAG